MSRVRRIIPIAACLFFLDARIAFPADPKPEPSIQQLSNKVKQLEERHRDDREETKAVRKNVADETAKRAQENAAIREELTRTKASLENLTQKMPASQSRFWVLLAAVLVFFMQAGFNCLEGGFVRKEHTPLHGALKLVSWVVPCCLYYVLGFGLMFGPSVNGFIGIPFLPDLASMQKLSGGFSLEFYLFQLAFAATAATIVSGALAERTRLLPYVITTAWMTLLVYPVVGHWAWGGNVYVVPVESGALQSLKFLDFAGSTVVHSVGGWFALVGAIFVGARKTRFPSQPPQPFLPLCLEFLKHSLSFKPATRQPNSGDYVPSNLALSTLGAFMLWFGWWGFNGGSKLIFDDDIAKIILNTNIAGACAALVACAHAAILDRANLFAKLIGGSLGGLVAITASCNIVEPYHAAIIGLLAGLVHNYAYDFLVWWQVDDPAGAIPVHAFCGVLGTLCVAMGNHGNSVFRQLMAQILGASAAFLYTVILAGAIFSVLRSFNCLRLSSEEEDQGWHGFGSYREETK